MPKEASLPTLADSFSSRYDVFYRSCVFFGCGILMPYNTFACSVDYLKETYSDYDATRWTVTCYLTFTLLGSLGNSFFPPKGVGHFRVTLGFVVFSLLFLAIPIMDWTLIDEDGATVTSFLSLLLCAMLIGIFNGVALGSFTGLMAHLPFRHFQGYLRGWGCAGIVNIALRAMTKVVFSDSPKGLRQSARIYFFLAVLFCLSCLLVQRWVIVPSSAWTIDSSMQAEGDPLLGDISSNLAESSAVWLIDAESSWWRTVKKTKLATVNTFIALFTLSVIFPGMPSDAENETLGDWYSIILIFLLCFGNLVGRYYPEKWLPSRPMVITVQIWSRLLLIPIAFFAMMYFANPFVISFLTLFVGVSGGYALLCCFKMAQNQLNGRIEQFVSGNILSFSTMLGLCAGSFGSLVWSALD